MTDPRDEDSARRLRRPLALTRIGLAAERAARAFWPAWTVALLLLASLMLGAHEALPLEAVWALLAGGAIALLAALGWGALRFRPPSRAEARERLDATLPGRPIAALADRDAVGGDDPASRAIWAAHQARMARAARSARAVPGDLRLASRDPYALRYVGLAALMVAILFGSLLRATAITEAVPGGATASVAGPSWEGWIEPPAHTGRPSLYLADLAPGEIEVPEGSRITLRLYGEVGRLTVQETVSGDTQPGPASDPQQSFEIVRSGRVAVDGPDGAAWTVLVQPDAAPAVEATGEPERSPEGETRLPFAASDDFAVTAGTATVALDLDAVDRRHGLAVEPEPREPVVVDLPLPITGDRSEFEEVLVADLAQHPFAGLPVTITLQVEDAPGQVSAPAVLEAELPGRAFFDPLARAVIEQRRDLLWSRENAGRVSQLLRAVSARPDDIFDQEVTYLRLRLALRRLEANTEAGLPDEARDEVAQMLWDVAVLIEEGRLSDALERMRQAQERLSEAMREGATNEEIAELMDELREATREYMRQLAQQEGQESQEFAGGERQEITQDQLQAMMDRIQELMEEGRMAEAQELLDQLSRMMENMQMAEGQPGEGGQPSPGEQAMQDLQDTLREQQQLSDESFQNLQQGQPGQPGQQPQPGQQGQQGQQGEPQPGQPGQGRQPGQGQAQQGQGGEPRPGQEGGSLADRQQALRDQLERQRGALPNDGSEAGERAAEALDRADEAMDGAEQALREDDIPQALDDQADAMEALREGMRALGEQLAEGPQDQGGGQGEQMGQSSPDARDPLGREAGSRGRIGTDEELLRGEDVYRRAEELLDELRRRSSDRTRPEDERRYYDRLLERF